MKLGKCAALALACLVNLTLFSNWLQGAERVRVGFSAISLANSPVWMAEERGFFKKSDLDVEAIVVGGGATRSVSAVIAGDLQFCTTGGGAIISSAFGGADVVMVAAGNNKGVQRLMVKP